MTDWFDDRAALHDHYADASNLRDRQALHEDYSTADTPLRAWQFAQFDLPETARVLTVGCGPGDLWPAVADRVPDGWSLALTDASAGMVAAARDALGDRADYAVADVTRLPFPDATFDAATANHMLYHVPDRAAALAELHRTIPPGGRLYATTNGEANLRTIYDVLGTVLDEPVARATSFTLENGREQLAQHFDEVEVRHHEDALDVDEVEPLVRYALSRDDVPASAAPDLHRAFAERFEDGHLVVEKDLGLFVARKARP